MNEIRVYLSIWRSVIDIVINGCLTAMGVAALLKGVKPAFVCWFVIIVFGFIGLSSLFTVLKERLGNKPYLVIKDESMTVRFGKEREIRFADVDSFQLSGFYFSKTIIINFPGTRKQDAFIARNLNMRPEAIFALLNERLAAAKKA